MPFKTNGSDLSARVDRIGLKSFPRTSSIQKTWLGINLWKKLFLQSYTVYITYVVFKRSHFTSAYNVNENEIGPWALVQSNQRVVTQTKFTLLFLKTADCCVKHFVTYHSVFSSMLPKEKGAPRGMKTILWYKTKRSLSIAFLGMNFLFLSWYFLFSENRIIIGDLTRSQNTRSNFDVDRMDTGQSLKEACRPYSKDKTFSNKGFLNNHVLLGVTRKGVE